ncbi:MAG: hypothetical protein AAB809_01975 [Patescibacteria group bacterium]
MGKIKQFVESEKGKDVLAIIIVILVGLASFELGRLSKGNGSSGIKIEYPTQDQEASVVSSTNYSNSLQDNKIEKTSTGKNFFASSRGSKYYPVGCEAGKSLKQENRVYFSTREEAERAGYELSSSCQ